MMDLSYPGPDPWISIPNPDINLNLTPRPGPSPSASSPTISTTTFRYFPDFDQPTSQFKRSHCRHASSQSTWETPPGDGVMATCDDFWPADDLFSTYIDVQKLEENGSEGNDDENEKGKKGGASIEDDGNSGGWKVEEKTVTNPSPLRRWLLPSEWEALEAKKAMPAQELSKLWSIDPKRAKRIVANRQSAARSKEKRARYITELEERVLALNKEATLLSQQLKAYQKDTTDLEAQNARLKLRLRSLERHSEQRDASNEALKLEIEKLKIVVGEMRSSKCVNAGERPVPHSPSCSQSASLQLASLPAAASKHSMSPRFLSPTTSRPLFEFLQANTPNSKRLDISRRAYLA